MFDIIDYANYRNVPGAVLILDIRRAFDSFRWLFMFATLKHYGFGNKTINWIKVLYKKPKCCIINNNFLSSIFDIHKGVRKGDFIFPTMFVSCTEYLVEMLRMCEMFQGFKIEKQCLKVSLFADE